MMVWAHCVTPHCCPAVLMVQMPYTGPRSLGPPSCLFYQASQ
jgi:hypothetical protein